MGKKEMKEMKEATVSAAKYKELERDYEEMKKKCEALVRGGAEMGEEILSLKRSVASYKSANTVLKRKVDGLEKDVERYKRLDSEGDSLNEKKAAEIESLKIALSSKGKTLEDKEQVISGLNTQVSELSQQVVKLKDVVTKKNADIQDLETSLEYEKLPWWKKILAH